ncbi:hypothetical protein RJ640_020123 [Escallonia rubra]|uniref:Uncharacterized protein n=1 Tax=Escallonia rubra TaxID=112253 RepID=A0AA88RID7_9ASTE|nr:hypothetical protein RJ640_020123 [Escallonia rubra]
MGRAMVVTMGELSRGELDSRLHGSKANFSSCEDAQQFGIRNLYRPRSKGDNCRRRIAGLHQNTSIGSTDITDMWEPLEEGLLPLETTRHVSVVTLTLSKKELDTSSPGYQPPIPADQVKPLTEYDYEAEGSPSMRGRGRGGRGRGRGRGRGYNNNGVVEYNGDGGWEGGRGYGGWDGGRGYGGRFRGRGRGRSYRGRGRGFGAGDMQQDMGVYNDYGGPGAMPAQGRGRGRGRGWGRGRGRSGDFRSDGPIQAAA